MSNNPNGANITLRLALEKAAAAESRATVQGLGKDFDVAAAKANIAGKSADTAINTIAAESNDATNAVKQLDNALDKAAKSAEKLSASGGKGFGLNNLKQVGGAVSQLGLGSSVSQLGAAGELIANLGTAAETAGVSITSTTVAVAGLEVALLPAVATIGAVAVAVGGLVAVLKLIDDQSKQAAEALKSVYDEQVKAVEQAAQNRELARTKTAEQNQQDIDDLSKKIDDYDKLLGELRDKRAAVDKAYADLGASFNPGERSRLGSEGQELDKEIAATREALDGLNAEFQNMTLELPALIEQEKARADVLAAQKKASEDFVAAEAEATQKRIESAKLLRDGTSAGVKTMLDDIQTAFSAKSDELLNLQIGGDKSETTKKRIEELKNELADLGEKSRDLNTTILPLITAREKEAEAAKKAQKAIEDKAKQDEKLADSYTKYNDDVAKIAQDGIDARTDIDQKYADDLAKIEQDGQLKRADIARDYADKLVDIARQAAQTAADELTRLEQKYADNQTGLGRGLQDAAQKAQQDELKIRVDAQREEARNLLEHQRNLEDIRRSAYANDAKNLRDRNFLALLDSREGAARAMEDENRRFSRQGQDSGTDVQQRIQDAQQAAAQERQARLQAYQRANEDARTQYQRALQTQAVAQERQLQQAAIAQQRALQDQARAELQARQQTQQGYTRDLQALQQKITRELQLRQQGYQKEITLLLQSEQARQQIIAQAAAAARRAVPQVGGGGSGTRYAATGGKIVVNDGGQREGFNGVPFPPVMGSFTPFKSGTISPSVGSSGQYIFNIKSNDPMGVRREVVSVLKEFMH
jgi:hypothetical protein